jgi:hypothetical protein
MAVGIATTKQQVDDKAASLIIALWRALDDLHEFKLWLDDGTHNDSFLTALGYSAPDITLLRNSIADLGGASGLWAVSHAAFTPSGSSNYFANAKQLTGVTYTG